MILSTILGIGGALLTHSSIKRQQDYQESSNREAGKYSADLQRKRGEYDAATIERQSIYREFDIISETNFQRTMKLAELNYTRAQLVFQAADAQLTGTYQLQSIQNNLSYAEESISAELDYQRVSLTRDLEFRNQSIEDEVEYQNTLREVNEDYDIGSIRRKTAHSTDMLSRDVAVEKRAVQITEKAQRNLFIDHMEAVQEVGEDFGLAEGAQQVQRSASGFSSSSPAFARKQSQSRRRLKDAVRSADRRHNQAMGELKFRQYSQETNIYKMEKQMDFISAQAEADVGNIQTVNDLEEAFSNRRAQREISYNTASITGRIDYLTSTADRELRQARTDATRDSAYVEAQTSSQVQQIKAESDYATTVLGQEINYLRDSAITMINRNRVESQREAAFTRYYNNLSASYSEKGYSQAANYYDGASKYTALGTLFNIGSVVLDRQN